MALQGAAIAGKGAATFGIAAGNMWQEGVNAENGKEMAVGGLEIGLGLLGMASESRCW